MTTSPVRFSFVEPISGDQCELVIPPGGRVFPEDGAPKIGVDHPGCIELADLAVHIDAWFCPKCSRSGRVAGNWVLDLMDASR